MSKPVQDNLEAMNDFRQNFSNSRHKTKSTCFKCLSMESQLFAKKTYTRFVASLSDLKNAATSCAVCHIMMSALRESDRVLFDQASEFESNSGLSYDAYGGTDIESSRGKKVSITLRVMLAIDPVHSIPVGGHYDCLELEANLLFGNRQLRHRGFEGGSKRRIQTFLHALQREDAQSELPYPLLGLDTRWAGDQKLSCIVEWLRMRERGANPCQQEYLPRRVLDVSDSNFVRLVDVNQIVAMRDPSGPGGIRYTALSHRWGASQHLVATVASLELFQAGVAIAQLPRTFQDAVHICQRLEIMYLWIDALCIVQDSLEDWSLESEKMGSIFQNAVITLAAHCAGDDSEGFLSSALAKPETVPCGKYMTLSRFSNDERDITNSRLSKRGWVLQERLMSLCTIHFTSGQVYFEDEDGITDEIDALNKKEKEWEDEDKPSEMDNVSSILAPATPGVHELRQMLMSYSFEKLSGESFKHDAARIWLDWLRLVEMFCRCELTKESDKLIAITGMARHVHAKIGQSWCAGVWKDSICRGLLWLSTKGGLTRPTQARAPSWSWAAYDGAVQYPVDTTGANFTPRCQFISMKNTSGTEVTWLNTLGSLTLKGYVVELRDLYFGDAIQVGPGPSRRGIIGEDLKGLPLMRLKDHAQAFWIRNIKANKEGWIVFDQADTKFVTQHSILGSFDATERMQNNSAFQPSSLFTDGEEYYFLILGTASSKDKTLVDRIFANFGDGMEGKDSSTKDETRSEFRNTRDLSNSLLRDDSGNTSNHSNENEARERMKTKKNVSGWDEVIEPLEMDEVSREHVAIKQDDWKEEVERRSSKSDLAALPPDPYLGESPSFSDSSSDSELERYISNLEGWSPLERSPSPSPFGDITPTYLGIYLVRSQTHQGSFQRVGFGQITNMNMQLREVVLV